MRKSSKFLAMFLVLSILLPGLVQAVPVVGEKGVKRLAGKDRIETAIAASKEVYKDGVNTVVLAGFNGEVDALTGTLLAGVRNAPVLLTTQDKLSSATETEIKRLNAKAIYILGGEKVVSKAIETKLKKSYKVERIAGTNRYGTAVNVAKNIKGTSAKHVFLALGNEAIKGDALADALAIGPVSAKEKMPVLLTQKDKIPTETKQALANLKTTHVTILGGKTAVSEKVEKELKGYTVNRVEGSDRYETSLKIAKTYFEKPENVVLAYGKKSADALVGGYLGAKMNAPILLTQKDKLNDNIETYIKDNSNRAFVLGGTTVISDIVFKKVEEAVAVNDSLDITIDKTTKLTRDYKTVKVTGNNVTVDLGGKTVQTLTVASNDTILKNGKIVNLNVEKEVVNVTLEDIIDDETGKHNFAGGGGESIVLKGKTNLKGTVAITSAKAIQIRSENLATGNGIKGKITINTKSPVTIAAPAQEIEVVAENKDIKIEAAVAKIIALANTNITLGKGIEAPKLEKAKGVEASAVDSNGKQQDFVVNDKLEPTNPVNPNPGGGGGGTPDPEPVKETKAKFAIESNGQEGYLSVDEDYNIKAVLPNEMQINKDKITVKVEMKDIKGLGIKNKITYEVDIDKLGEFITNPNLNNHIGGLLALKSSVIDIKFGENKVQYTLNRNNTNTHNVWQLEPNNKTSGQAAWNHILQALDKDIVQQNRNSKIEIKKDAYLAIGNQKLLLEKDLLLDKSSDSLATMEQKIRQATGLKPKDENITSQIESYMTKDSIVKVGPIQAKLTKNITVGISGLKKGVDLDSILPAVQSSNNTKDTLKNSFDILNKIANGMQGATSIDPIEITIK